MKLLVWFLAFLLTALTAHSYLARQAAQQPQPEVLHCAAFSPYVGAFNPDWGPHPNPELIDQLLDNLIKHTPFRCIMTYGVLNGLDYTFAAAKKRQLKVIAILWLDKDIAVNSQSISKGIEAARTYPDTLVRLSCGSEVRTRHSHAFDSEITRCLNALREAKVSQPISTIDTWWEWCNRSLICAPTQFGAQVDWIGVNVFPWWENKHSGAYTCIPAAKAADFHIDRIQTIRNTYPGKEVILTEFGWPYGPEQRSEINEHTGKHCGIASKSNQRQVIKQTFAQLTQKNWSGVVFEAYSENWKPANEGPFGDYWGICQNTPPYSCGLQ
jgi:exo-beta-1,3-glucanase (GH17 family)